MFITVKQEPNSNVASNKALIKIKALERLAMCRLSKSELALNDYCLENYNKSLKATCKYLIDYCSIQFNQEDTFFVLFNTPELDNLASLITYGNEKVRGSNILRLLFYSNKE